MDRTFLETVIKAGLQTIAELVLCEAPTTFLKYITVGRKGTSVWRAANRNLHTAYAPRKKSIMACHIRYTETSTVYKQE